MKYGIRTEVPGLTVDQYSRMHGVIGPTSLKARGFISHAAGPTADGWYLIDVWESKDDHDRFFRDEVLPMLPADGPTPRVEEYEVHTFESA